MKRLRKNKATYCCSVVDNPFFEYQHLFYIPTILLCLAINIHKQASNKQKIFVLATYDKEC